VELVQRAERVGVAWITVHGRTTRQRAEPANMDAVKLVGRAGAAYIVLVTVMTSCFNIILVG